MKRVKRVKRRYQHSRTISPPVQILLGLCAIILLLLVGLKPAAGTAIIAFLTALGSTIITFLMAYRAVFRPKDESQWEARDEPPPEQHNGTHPDHPPSHPTSPS